MTCQEQCSALVAIWDGAWCRTLPWPQSGHKIPQSTVYVSRRLKCPLLKGIQGKSHRPFSYQVANPCGHCWRPFRVGVEIVSSCRKLRGLLSDGHWYEVGRERPALRTNNWHCSQFPQRYWVSFTLTESLSGTVRFRISAETLPFNIQSSAEETRSLNPVSLLGAMTHAPQRQKLLWVNNACYSLSVHIYWGPPTTCHCITPFPKQPTNPRCRNDWTDAVGLMADLR